MTHVYNSHKREFLQGDTDLENDDIRCILLSTNTTADTENDGISTVADFTTLDEFNGAGYTSADQDLTGKVVNLDNANDRAEFDATDRAYGALSAGTRDIAGVLLIKFVTNLNASLPISFHTLSASPDGSSFTLQFNAEGILQLS